MRSINQLTQCQPTFPRQKRACPCLPVAFFVVASFAATDLRADISTYLVQFEAHTFQVEQNSPGPAPIDPVMGSFTISFDPTLEYTNNTANVSLNSLNLALGSALAFIYEPDVDGGTLRVGGLASGANIVTFNPPTNDFWFFSTQWQTTPEFQQVGYSQTSVGQANLYFTLQDPQWGTVSASAIPEPSTFACLSFGLVGMAFFRRKTQRLP